jgi:X-Pro dipeptidyl-peptidase
VANDVEHDPPFHVFVPTPLPRAPGAPAFELKSYESYPVPGTEPVRLYGSRGGTGVGALRMSPGTGTETLIDSVAVSGSANASRPRSGTRLLYATAPLTDSLHISGTVRVALRVASNRPVANLSVWLVTLPYDSTTLGSQGHQGVVTRGWADVQNYKSLKGGDYNSRVKGEALVPGRFYDLTFDLEPDEQMIPPGKQLAVMIMSSDAEFTLWPSPGTQLTIDLAKSSFTIPIVGGVRQLTHAGVVGKN